MESVAIVSKPGGAIGQYLIHLWHELKRLVVPHCVVLNRPEVQELTAAGIVHVHPLVEPTRRESIVEVVRLLEQENIRLVNLHVATYLMRDLDYFIALLSAMNEAGRRIVLTLHNVLPFAYFPVDMRQVRELYRLGHGYVVGTPAESQVLRDNFQVGDRPVGVAPHGPFTRLDQKRFDRSAARQFLGLPDTAPLVLFFGYLRPEKRLDCLLQSFQAVRERLPDAELLIQVVTERWAAGQTWLAGIAQSCRHLGIRTRDEFLPNDMLEPLFRAMDVVALPYSRVTQSGVLNLAKAFQRPVVVTDVFDRSAEIDRTYGRSVPVNDPAALADALVELLTLSERQRQEMGARGLELALKNESWQHHADSLMEVCRRVCG